MKEGAVLKTIRRATGGSLWAGCCSSAYAVATPLPRRSPSPLERWTSGDRNKSGRSTRSSPSRRSRHGREGVSPIRRGLPKVCSPSRARTPNGTKTTRRDLAPPYPTTPSCPSPPVDDCDCHCRVSVRTGGGTGSDHRADSGLGGGEESAKAIQSMIEEARQARRRHPRHGDFDGHAACWRDWGICSTSGIIEYHLEGEGKAGRGHLENA